MTEEQREDRVVSFLMEEVVQLRARLAAAEKVAHALRLYLMAGHKDARREASAVAKAALAEYDAEGRKSG